MRKTGIITATTNHPFWVNDPGKWVDAEHLSTGDLLLSYVGGLYPVEGSSGYIGLGEVHNLTVAGIHTYSVLLGDISVLVHNAGCDEWASKHQARYGGEVKTFQAPDGAPYLGDYSLARNESCGHHTVVVRNGRVYDQYTGPRGMPIEDWKRKWTYHNILISDFD